MNQLTNRMDGLGVSNKTTSEVGELGSPKNLTADLAGDRLEGHLEVVRSWKTSVHNLSEDGDDVEQICSHLGGNSFEVRVEKRNAGKWTKHTCSADISIRTTVSARTSAETFARSLLATWKDFVDCRDFRLLWLQIDNSILPEATFNDSRQKLIASRLSLGSFPEASCYMTHWESQWCSNEQRMTNICGLSNAGVNGDWKPISDSILTVLFDHDRKTATVHWIETENLTSSMEIKYNSLNKLILISKSTSVYRIFLFLGGPPKLYNESIECSDMGCEVGTGVGKPKTCVERDVCFLDCTQDTIGGSNVLQLELPTSEWDVLGNILSSFKTQGYELCWAFPSVVKHDPRQVTEFPPAGSSFELCYAWSCLSSRGFKVTDQINDNFVKLIRDNPIRESELIRIIHSVNAQCESLGIVDLESMFWHEFNGRKKAFEHDAMKRFRDISNLVNVRQVVLTPNRTIILTEGTTKSNRIVRKFGADRFLLVTIRDEDFKLFTPSFIQISKPIEAIHARLRQGLRIGDRLYEVLSCSRDWLMGKRTEHGLWMYAGDEERTVESIRQWIGNMPDERCVGTYLAGLGLGFSSTKSTMNIAEDKVEIIEDVVHDGYLFTEGIGKISKSLAEKIYNLLNPNHKHLPSAFHIRFGGCKGVVAVDPKLGENDLMQIRESMIKFQSDFRTLEVMRTSKPASLCLNRQVIALMSGLGIPDEIFLHLQGSMLRKLADMLVYDTTAMEALHSFPMPFKIDLENMNECGISFPAEPFFRSILQTLYLRRLEDLQRKARIEIPDDQGRLMMGTVDETGTLEYGQVFVQCSLLISEPQSDKQVVTGPVLVAKNPCLHPGDMRKFTAVDRPELYHMVDCIVFPAKGKRPHPNEMSGSDLDGDKYFVCWMEDLLPARENEEAMDYSPQKKSDLGHEIAAPDMIDFIAEFMSSDRLGAIATAHLVHADADTYGIFSQKCIDLAKLHSDAVDSSKTGYIPKLLDSLRPTAFPHYMEKPNRPVYTSTNVLGKLFDQCELIEQTNLGKLASSAGVQADPELLWPGYERYVGSDSVRAIREFYDTSIKNLMKTYAIESEAEILSGNILKMKKNPGFRKKGREEISDLVKEQLKDIVKRIKAMFFQEFENRGTTEVSRKASALYAVTYASKDQFVGLPWIFSDLLAEIKSSNRGQSTKSVLFCLSEEVVEAAARLDKVMLEQRQVKYGIYQMICNALREHNPKAELILFGSTVTMLDWKGSPMDIYVGLEKDEEKTQDAFGELIKKLTDSLSSKNVHSESFEIFGRKVKVVIDKVRITFHREQQCLKRTAYILATLSKNKWILPSVKVVLQWGRNVCLADDLSDCILSTDELALTFIDFASSKYDGIWLKTDERELEKALTLLKQEHHLGKSDISQCLHLQVNRNDDNMTGEVNCAHSDRINCGELVLQFFRHNSLARDEIVNHFEGTLDPCSFGRAKLFTLKQEQYQRISDRFNQAYHLLSYKGSIHQFLNAEYSDGSNRFVKQLPRQVSSVILYTEECKARELQQSTGADWVKIRHVHFPNAVSGLVLEAQGEPGALLKLRERIRDEIAYASLFTRGNVPISPNFIRGAYKHCFEGNEGPHSQLVFDIYDGPCQSALAHKKQKHVPRLLEPNSRAVFDRETFISNFMDAVNNFCRHFFKKNQHGDLRAVISFGTAYLNYCSFEKMSLSSYTELLSLPEWENRDALVNRGAIQSKSDDENDDTNSKDRALAAENSVPGRGNSRGRGGRMSGNCRGRGRVDNNGGIYQTPTSGFPRGRGRGWTNNRGRRSIRPGWIPAFDEKLVTLQKYLEENSFVESERKREYRITIRIAKTKLDGCIVLDETFSLKYFYMPDIKWLVLDVFRCGYGGEKPYDMRFKMQSRCMRTRDELSSDPIFEDILKNHSSMILRNEKGKVIGVHENYKYRVDFMRYKDVCVYKYKRNDEDPQDRRDFLQNIAIRINKGKEFRGAIGGDGLFKDDITDNRVEVTSVITLPDMNDDVACEEFIGKVWNFARELGDLLKG